MDMSNTQDRVEAELKTILSDRAKGLQVLDDSVVEDMAMRAKAEAAMDAAVNDNDQKAYSAAKSAMQTAADAAELHQKRRDKLSNQPLITPSYYETTKKALMDDMAQHDAQSKAKVIKLLKEIVVICNEDLDYIKRGNRILNTLVFDVKNEQDKGITDFRGDSKMLAYRNVNYPESQLEGVLYHTVKGCVLYKQLCDESGE